MNKLMRNALSLGAAASLLLTSGCYSLVVSAQDVNKPVSLTSSMGAKGTTVRHFRYSFTEWYGVGLVPLISTGANVPTMAPADKIVGDVLLDELKAGGDGIVNLHVTQQYGWLEIAYRVVPGVVIYLIDFAVPSVAGALGLLQNIYNVGLQPIGVIVEGDVVKKGAHAELPNGPVISTHEQKLDLAGVDLKGMLIRATRSNKRPDAQPHG